MIEVTSRKVVATIPTGARPRSVVFSRQGYHAYVSNENGGTITLVDTKKHQALRELPLPSGAKPMGIALSRDDRNLYVTTARKKSVLILEAGTGQVQHELKDVGARPWGIALSEDGKRLYTANGPSHDVSVIDLDQRKVLKRIALGSGASPWGPAQLPLDEPAADAR